MVMSFQGLNARRLQDVEKFDAHAATVELLLMLKDLVANPQTLTNLAKAKADALKLTEDEEKKRQDALDLIARTDELKNSFTALDERERNVDQKHKDNLNQIESMKADMKAGFAERESRLKDQEDKSAKTAKAIEEGVKNLADAGKRHEEACRKKIESLDARENDLKKWEEEIHSRLEVVTEREKALFKK